MIVMKFGGSSVAHAVAIREVAGIVKAHADRNPIVVVSAMQGVTDQTYRLYDQACVYPNIRFGYHVRDPHFAALRELEADRLGVGQLVALFEERKRLLIEVNENGHVDDFGRAAVVAYGEKFSACIVAAALRAAGLRACMVDASEMIVTDDRPLYAGVRFAETDERIRAELVPLLDQGVIPVVTGFIAATADGQTTLLGRGGSDYTATIIAAAMKAEEVILWKEVDGIMTADPRVVPDAALLEAVSYAEARELAHHGAKILHPLAVGPVERRGIPMRIRNTFDLAAAGTRIFRDCAWAPAGVRAVTAIRDLTMVTVSGSDMAGVVGYSAVIFGLARDEKINLIMYGQSSSEQEIWLVVRRDAGKRLADAFQQKLLDDGVLNRVSNGPVSAVAVVGDGMAGELGVFARAATALAEEQVSIKAAAQGSSERNISFVVRDEDADRSVRALHRAFGLSQQRSKS